MCLLTGCCKGNHRAKPPVIENAWDMRDGGVGRATRALSLMIIAIESDTTGSVVPQAVLFTATGAAFEYTRALSAPMEAAVSDVYRQVISLLQEL